VNRLVLDLTLIVVFLLVGAVFSAAEMALISLREPQVKELAHRGRRGQTIAELSHNPNRFLSAVQIGSTLAGFLSASFGAATLAGAYMSPWLARLGMGQTAAQLISLVAITLVISFFSIVISELTSKRLAMQRPESYAWALTPVVSGIAALFRPVIWLMGVCTDALVRLLRGDPALGKQRVTDEELRLMVTSSATLGLEERHIVSDVFDAGDRSLREAMVPRTEVRFLSADMSVSKALREVKNAPYSRYPVMDGSADKVIGFLHIRDLVDVYQDQHARSVRRLVRPVVRLPETVRVLPALTLLRRTHAHLAIVVDEYGGTAGIVTLEDLVEEVIGEITDEYDLPVASLAFGPDDVAGLTTVDEFTDLTGWQLPDGPYDTLAGYFTAQLGRVAEVGDTIAVTLTTPDADQGAHAVTMRAEAMDGRRIDRVSIHR